MIKKIRRFLKILVGLLFLMLLLFTIGTALFIYLFPEEKALAFIQNKAEEALNSPVEIKSLNYGLKGITLKDITVLYSGEDKENINLLKIDEASILFSIFSLFRDEIHIWSVSLNGAVINFYFNKDGTHNFSKLISNLKNNKGKSPADNSGRKVKISRIVLNDSKFILGNLPSDYKPLQGEYNFSSNIDINDNNTFSIHNSRVILPENRGIISPELDLILTDTFLIKGKAELDRCSLLWVYRFADKDPELPFETVTAEVQDLEITADHVKGRAKGFSTLKKTSKKADVEGWCKVDLNTLLVTIYDVKGTIDKSSFNLDSLVISGNRGDLVSFKASKADALIPDLRIVLDFLPKGLYGGVKGGLSYDGKKYNGRLDLSGCGLITESEIFSGLSTEIIINNNEFKKENIPLKIFGNPGTISIATTGSNFDSFYLFLQSNSINLNEIINRYSEGSSSGITAETGDDISVNGKIVVNELTYDSIKFRNTSVDFTYSGSSISINKINTSTLSGSITGSGRVSLSGKKPVINTSLAFRNIKLQDFPFSNDELKNRFFGFADGNASLSVVPGKNPEDTVKGKIVFNISKGKVVNTGVQNGLILFLAELRYKLRDLEFNKIYGNIDLDTGKYNINSFIFNSEDIRLSINGVLDSNLHAKDMQMKLEFNNHFIKDIPRPAVAVLNKYQSGRWYIMPFVIKGDITNSKNINLVDGNQ